MSWLEKIIIPGDIIGDVYNKGMIILTIKYLQGLIREDPKERSLHFVPWNFWLPQ